jgi:hypothetical protein
VGSHESVKDERELDLANQAELVRSRNVGHWAAKHNAAKHSAAKHRAAKHRAQRKASPDGLKTPSFLDHAHRSPVTLDMIEPINPYEDEPASKRDHRRKTDKAKAGEHSAIATSGELKPFQP